METIQEDIIFQRLWAKTDPYKSLIQHMKEAGIVAEVLLEESIFSGVKFKLCELLQLTETQVVAFVSYVTALHDIGKCHPLFQYNKHGKSIEINNTTCGEMNYPFSVNDYRHEIGTATALKRIWKKKKRLDINIRNSLSMVLKVHHQGKHGKDYSLKDDNWLAGKRWMELQERLEQNIFDYFCPPEFHLDSMKEIDNVCVLITGIVIISDWIASGSIFQLTTEYDDEAVLKNKARMFINCAGLNNQKLPSADKFSSLWKWIKKDQQRPLQKGVEMTMQEDVAMPLITIIEAPMGEGKTEAGIYSAIKMAEYWKKQGMYVALPTSATANQMIDRVQHLLKCHDIRGAQLIHGLSWVTKDELFPEEMDTDEIEASRWLMSSKLALLSPYSVGTIDQAMMAALRIRYGLIRMLGLFGKVLIIDEVHAYDAYMSSIIERLLEWCKSLKIPVVLLSATLPLWKKQQMLSIYGTVNKLSDNYQVITCGFDDGSIKERDVDEVIQKKEILLDYILSDDLVKTIDAKIKSLEFNSGCICVIVNTIKSAQAIYDKLRKEVDCEIILFHSRFPVSRRNEIEKKCISFFGPDKEKRPKKAILIATQVVEQSLDLDFDYMITEIAPVDLIFQRLGRLHRHSSTSRPKKFNLPTLSVISYNESNYGATEKIYYKLLLERTDETIKDAQIIHIPKNIPTMVNSVYQKEMAKQNEIDAFFEQKFDEQAKQGFARNVELWKPSDDGFGLIESGTEFEDDSDDSWVVAKTRLAEKSIKVAILPQNIFEEAYNQYRENGRINSNYSKKIIMFSCGTPEKLLKPIINQLPKDEHCFWGTGRLNGMVILRADDATHNDTNCNLSHTFENVIITFDKFLGLILKERK